MTPLLFVFRSWLPYYKSVSRIYMYVYGKGDRYPLTKDLQAGKIIICVQNPTRSSFLQVTLFVRYFGKPLIAFEDDLQLVLT
jgi:hypothetical protein